MISRRLIGGGVSFLMVLAAVSQGSAAVAEPWVRIGDPGLRHDVQLLADGGLIRSPFSTWPNSWPQIAREVSGIDVAAIPEPLQGALARVSRAARAAMRGGRVAIEARVAAAEQPTPLRTFEDTPREQGEVRGSAAYMGERFAWRAEAMVVVDPSDGQTVRPDGSYVGLILGNWIVSVGYIEQWWGPGWEGSLILSNSARPIPSIAVERNYADPFDTEWLSWIGPWRLNVRLGELEGDRDDFANARFFAMRVNVRPLESLELGLSRSAQFCGDGRPCGLGEFWDLLIGNDNDQPLEEQPGNQLAGFDVRWSLPWDWTPVALYAQMIGEDEAGFLPSKYLGLFGVETWGPSGGGTWRAHVEYADTTCNFLRQDPEFGCAYTNVIYTDGYTYHDRSIGHALGGDGRMLSAGLLYVDARGNVWRGLVRHIELNREGVSANHPITQVPLELMNVELSTTRQYDFGTMRLGLGYDRFEESPIDDADDEFRGFLEWHHAF